MASCRNDVSVWPGKPLIINWSAVARKMQFPSGMTSFTSKLLSKANLRMDLLNTGRFLACSKPSPDKLRYVYNIITDMQNFLMNPLTKNICLKHEESLKLNIVHQQFV